MDDSTLIHPKNVCDNNCEQIKSLLDTPPIDGSNFFKYVNIFDDMECITTDSLYKYQNYNSAPFKNRNELFEILDGLREKNSESKEFDNNEVEKILYRMFPSDYSVSFNIDGIGISESGRPYYLICLKNSTNTKVPSTIDSDGMLISEEKPDEYKDEFARERKVKKDHLRELIKQIAKLNSDIHDLSIFNKTTYIELQKEKQKVKELKEEVWILYTNSLSKDELFNDTQSNTRLPLQGSLDRQRAHTYFQKAIDNGLLKYENGEFSWVQIGNRGGNSQLAYFCGKVFEYEHSISGNVGTSFPEEELNKIFGIPRMQSLLQQVYEAKKIQSWRRIIDELFE